VIAVYRFGQWCINRKQGIVKTVLTALHLPVFSIITLLTGIHLPRGAKIGGGLRIWHFGGIVLNPDTVIGKNCTLRHGVTIGNRKSEHDVPVIGDNVDIGVGAVIMGAVVVGDNVSIGANAVVLCDVPDNHIAVGVLARVIPRNKKVVTCP
jgi:serine O-acetyltransferase